MTDIAFALMGAGLVVLLYAIRASSRKMISVAQVLLYASLATSVGGWPRFRVSLYPERTPNMSRRRKICMEVGFSGILDTEDLVAHIMSLLRRQNLSNPYVVVEVDDCPTCGHPLSKHDPEDSTCDVFSGDLEVGVCRCGRQP